MASYKAPRRFFILESEEFPLTPTGKVWRKELQRRLIDSPEPAAKERT
jgi:acyl-CoA synthetase (AMP-forming)/AMP-acid ligase II